MKAAVALVLVPVLVSGHGNSVYPPAWWDAGGKVTLQPGNNCYAGCGGKKKDCQPACMWFSDITLLADGDEETNAVENTSPLRTYYDINIHPLYPTAPDYPIDLYHRHAWRHPGKAPIWSPCGIGGGNPRGCFAPGTTTPIPCPAGAVAHGPDARYYDFPDVVTTAWKQGQQVEAAWQITANHGGGYSYRLCPTQTAEQPAGMPLDETCFQARVLDFVGDKQWFQIGKNRSTRAMFGDVPAVRTTKGTWPGGSMWTRNPIPACHGPGSVSAEGRGGGNQTAYPNKGGSIPCSKESYRGSPHYGIYEGPQFEPHGGYPGKYEGIYTFGFGNDQQENSGGSFLFSIVDLLQVPKDISPGKYVLSHRYDCEQTIQVWNTCANIEILPANSTEPDGALIPDGPTGMELPHFDPMPVTWPGSPGILV